MTTPPHTTTGSFTGVLHPADVAAILNLLVTGSPFANVLRRYPTNRSEVAFPTAKPDRPAWLGEFEEIPVVGLGDDASVVGVCKLASIVLMSNESARDTSVNLTNEFAVLLRDTASAELDRGVLYGTGADADSREPVGVVTSAPAAAGADLGAAISAAVGSIGDAGGAATHIAARPSVLAAARDTRETDGSNLLVFPDGIGPAYGLTEVPTPELDADDILVLDQTRTWLIVRNDFQVDTSGDAFYSRDAWAVRLRGRFAVAAPDLPKSLRKLNVGGAGSTAPETPAKARAKTA